MRALAVVLAIVALSTEARAQENAPGLLAADRPGFPAITKTTPKGRFITEADAVVTLGRPDVALATPLLLARYGLLPWLELRAQLPSAVVDFPRGQGDARLSSDQASLGVGMAGRIGDGVFGGVVPTLVVPAGDQGGARGIEGFVEASIAWTITAEWQLQVGVNTGWLQAFIPDLGLRPIFRFTGGATIVYTPIRTFMLFAQSLVRYRVDLETRPIFGGGFAWWPLPSTLAIYGEVDAGVDTPDVPPLFDVGAAWMW
jgi:hypothetical protein